MAKAEEKYFVCGCGDHPEQMFFDKMAALAADYDYMDSFDNKGRLVESYKRQDVNTYTTDF